MEANLKVSIIIPCYNQAEFLTETIDSVLFQTYQNWECIIVNDGSTDATEEIAREYCKIDSRFIYIGKENGGLSSARNAGLDIAKSDFIQFLDSDDLIGPEKLQIQLERVQREEADIIIGGYKLFTINSGSYFDNHLSSGPINLSKEGFLFDWGVNFTIAIHAGLFSSSFLTKHKIRFNESVNAREDWIFWCTLSIAGAKFTYIDQYLAFYRVHKHSMTNNLERMQHSYIASILAVDDLLHGDLKVKFRGKISQICIEQVLKSYCDNGYLIKKDSIEFRLGYMLLYPFKWLHLKLVKIRKVFLR
jgi:glycosyltransferase involved in cell wall biosynthesis